MAWHKSRGEKEREGKRRKKKKGAEEKQSGRDKDGKKG